MGEHRTVLWVCILLSAVALVLPILNITGCTDADIVDMRQRLGDIGAAIAGTKEGLSAATTQKAEIDKWIETLPEGPEKRKAIETRNKVVEYIDKTQLWLVAAEATLKEMEKALDAGGNAIDATGAAIQTTAPLLPPPWNAIIAAVGGLGVGLWRAAYNRSKAREIVKSVDPILEAQLKDVPSLSATVAANQSAAAERIVDEAQGKKFALPF